MRAEFDVYAEDIPKYISKEMTFKNKEGALESAEKKIKHIKEIFAVVAVSPRAAGLEMKKPYIFEAMVSGGDIQQQFTHVKELLGKERCNCRCCSNYKRSWMARYHEKMGCQKETTQI